MTADDTVSRWAAIVGPCYPETGMARTLDCSEEEVREASRTPRLLALETSDRVTLYPASQLDEGRVVAGLSEVLRPSLGYRNAPSWGESSASWVASAAAGDGSPHGERPGIGRCVIPLLSRHPSSA